MKTCPTCTRTFEDTFTFCLIDGAVLSPPFDPQATLVLQRSSPTEAAADPEATDEVWTQPTLLPTVASPLPAESTTDPTDTMAVPVTDPPVIAPTLSPTVDGSSQLAWIVYGASALVLILVIYLAVTNQREKSAVPSDAKNSNAAATVGANANRSVTPVPTPSPTPAEPLLLEGTVWKILRENGNQETFEFNADGKMIRRRPEPVTCTWQQHGSEVVIMVPETNEYFHSRIEGTVHGDEISGTIDYLGEQANQPFSGNRIK